MPEETLVAETNVEESTVEEVATTQEETNDVVFEDTQKVQSDEDNKEFARRRRQQERETELAKVKMEATLEALDNRNPYTNEEMKDEADYNEYLKMREMKLAGLDPLTDYSKYLKDKEREQERLRIDNEKKINQARLDMDEFKNRYPDTNVQEVLGDENCKVYIRYYGNLTEGYTKYLEAQSSFKTKAEHSVAQQLANANASVGSQRNNREAYQKSISQMTSEEFAKLKRDVESGKYKH